MGAGASTTTAAAATLVINAECQRPLDASDVDALDAHAARAEVVRLRGLLAAHADVIRRAVDVSPSDSVPIHTKTSGTTCVDSAQQTDAACATECDRAPTPSRSTTSLAHESSTLSANASHSALGLAPGIQDYLITCFASADLDRSGVLSTDEFARLLREHSELGLSPEDIQLLLAQAKWMDAKGDVTWQQFVHLAPQLLANLADASSPNGRPSASDWCACITAEGTPYYYNKRTQASVWDKPAELVNPEQKSQQAQQTVSETPSQQQQQDKRLQQGTTSTQLDQPLTVAVGALTRTASTKTRPRSG